ncbi:seryl-tRNA synthetase [Nematocida parisii]|uniref:serine--tRNA ligase n=1 Tax=Nematocida parisii (strain ERTm3) TaxID=935791 RepID=I3EET0_NEMP3|nr:seryl-tRNA synthetase [Nematocida parisii ERTm1]EIJ87727.1 seryl-tRNA synthetase [Nematocida parisii ERTm3]KAI5127752.1 seryl-tRNA synthetase [Nematocida parisii]EIJ92957.1 seryl-tRNA synthetase [Nematocida parisii ERTm1]KAI5131095.1 seryl-tRNA synthetase [Nematocida parisii]KAI5141593.1 seryl-tRNA synthetase [Nematocida parisii]|eukprot:XP_013060183.1 seryl-tRNA synthetase [Nematocida parisii ERTm1]
MIDLSILRNKDTRQLVMESESNRFRGTKTAEKVVDMIEERIKIRYVMEQLNKEMNSLTKEGMKYFKVTKDKGSPEDNGKKQELLDRIAEIKEKKSKCVVELNTKEEETDNIAREIGNILDKSVCIDDNEDNNPIIVQTEKRTKEFWPKQLLSYDLVLDRLGVVDTERGTRISGHRGYFLKGAGVILTQSLIRYALDFLRKSDYTLIQTPFMMRKESMKRTAQLSDFDEQLYKVEGGNDLYLIATSEQPLSALHEGEWIKETELPIRYGGYSTCFRKEAGAHGKDNRGIFRVHQFEKIEQFLITAPEESEAEFKKMVDRSKAFYDSLGLSYRVVSIVSGALNNAAAIKYDLEALFPASDRYRELVSCSNCTDYQSRDLNVRYRPTESNEEKQFVHMLNGTLCAVQRTLCCLVENYQTEGGIMVPEVLVPYVGETFIPFIRE